MTPREIAAHNQGVQTAIDIIRAAAVSLPLRVNSFLALAEELEGCKIAVNP